MAEMRTERGAAQVRDRGIALLEEAAEQSRPRRVAGRLRTNARWFVQAALATALSWAAAIAVFGHPRPIFAPVAALIGVSTTLGQRRRYAVEMVVGIALGVGIADALFVVIGSGTLQIAAIVAGAMVAAVALGGSVVLVSEAAVSALLVVTVQPPSSGLSGARFLDSLLGGMIALAITSLLPTDPVRAARRAAALPLAQIAATLEDVARALDRVDLQLAERALARARIVERDAFEQAVAAGRETLQLAPFTRATRAHFARYVRAQEQIDTAITSAEALTRAVVRALKHGDNALEQLLIHLDGIERQLDTLDARLAEIAGSERWAGQVQILTRFRGIATITALGLIAEIGDFHRFSHPRELAAWLGITPSEYSSGDQQHRGHITLSGNKHARRLLIEAAWHYRHAPRRPATGPPPDERAWQAQVRLYHRHRHLTDHGKRSTVANVAVARELIGFLWAAMTNQPMRATDTTTSSVNRDQLQEAAA